MSRARHPFRRRFRSNVEALPEVEVSEKDGIRSLHLGSETVQTSMKIKDPIELVLSYSRAMMGFMLFCSSPNQIVQVGLGGGALARFVHHHLPNACSVAVEINPKVIDVAMSLFGLPDENEHFSVVEANGAEYIRLFNQSVDVILVDGFDGFQVARDLVTEDFFMDCYRALTSQGVFVANWWRGDKRYPSLVRSLSGVFAGQVLELPSTTHGNVCVMAFRDALTNVTLEQLRQKARQLEARLGLEFGDFVERLANASFFVAKRVR